ncbi:MAG: hypothetical protein ABFC80_05465 [Coriobacteriales bacterium]
MSANHTWLGASAVIGLSREEKRCLAKYLLLLEKDAVLAPQAPQLVALIARETILEPFIDLGLVDPRAQRPGCDADLAGGGLDAVPAETVETDRLGPELRCVRHALTPFRPLRVYF